MTDDDDGRFRYPIWTRGDLDGFFGLMVDNLVQVLMISAMCTTIAGLPVEMVYQRIMPGVAISLVVGNLFYGLQAHYVARRHRNRQCTALPYGINTPSVVAFVIFVMGPVYHEAVANGTAAESAARLAWLAGVAACLVSGLVEFFGAFVAERLRRVTPRAALLGVLAAIGITFIASDFAFQIYTKPMVGLLPMGILLLAYFARHRFPLRIPGGFIAVLLGSLIAWGMTAGDVRSFGGTTSLAWGNVTAALGNVGWITPRFWGAEIVELFTSTDLALRFLAVSIPMGLMNLLGSLQNIESAEAGGDRFATAPSLAVNGIGSIMAGLFGSCFPTTIYIGHPGWKALGARSGYSILNGLFFAACFLFGLGPLLEAIVPIEAGAALVMYIGIIITAQAFQASPREHAPAVAIALFPALAALLIVTLSAFLRDAGAVQTFADLVKSPTPGTLTLGGMLTLTGANSSWIVGTLIIAAMAAALIDRKYVAAAVWSALGAVLTAVGLLHAYRLEGNLIRELFIWQGWTRATEVATTQAAEIAATMPAAATTYTYRAWPIAVSYALIALVFVAAARWRSKKSEV